MARTQKDKLNNLKLCKEISRGGGATLCNGLFGGGSARKGYLFKASGI